MTQQPLYRSNKIFFSKGFTLVEIVVVVGIVSVIGLLIAKFQSDVFSFNRTFSSSFTTADSAQKLLRPMTAEIRSASPSSSGAFPIDSIGQYNFSFYSDIDNDGLKELVKYYATGTVMYKDVIKPTGNTPAVYNTANKVTTTFITGVRNISDNVPIFQYYSSAYTGGAGGEVLPSGGKVEDVRLVKISIKIDDDSNKAPIALTVSSQVSIRNLKQQ